MHIKYNSIVIFLLISSTLSCMETTTYSFTDDAAKSKRILSPLISFLEAIMAGGKLCVNTQKNTVRFKHFRKVKYFKMSLQNLPHLTDEPIDLDTHESIQHFLTQYNVLLDAHGTFKRYILYEQLLRFQKYNENALFAYVQKYMGEKRRVLKKRIRSFLKTMSDEEIGTLAGFKNVSQEKHSEVIERVMGHCRNRFMLEKALLDCDAEALSKASFQQVQNDYVPLGNNIGIHKVGLDLHAMRLGKPISFIEALHNGGPFVIDHAQKSLTFKHYRKDKTYTVYDLDLAMPTIEDTHQKLLLLLEEMFEKEDQTSYLKLLALIEPLQRKKVVFMWYMINRRHIHSVGQDMEKGYRMNLIKINAEGQRKLEGCAAGNGDYEVYTRRVVEAYNNYRALDEAIRDRDLEKFDRSHRETPGIPMVSFLEMLKITEKNASA